MKRFEDKVAIITGEAQGIGEATTRRLANEGAMTAILDIQPDNAQAVAEEILSQGGKKSIAVKMDITDSQEVKRAVREVEETFGRVDVLINNVGMEELGLFIESTEESWDWKIAVNLKGPMTVTKAVLEGMVPRKYGRIVNISSDAGRAGQFGEAAYGAAKGRRSSSWRVRRRRAGRSKRRSVMTAEKPRLSAATSLTRPPSLRRLIKRPPPMARSISFSTMPEAAVWRIFRTSRAKNSVALFA